MTQEQINQGLSILDNIGFEEIMIKRIKEVMSEIQLAGKYTIKNGFYENIDVPYNVFHDYFLNEIKNREKKIESLKKEFEQL